MAIQPMGPSQFQLLDPLSALLYMLLIGEKGYEKSFAATTCLMVEHSIPLPVAD